MTNHWVTCRTARRSWWKAATSLKTTHGLQVDPEGPGKRGDDHPRRSAIHADLVGRGHVRAHPARHRRRVPEHDGWRDKERWLRRYCPTCGSLPAMAQLVGVDAGRARVLLCGCCGTRWQFKRTGCPFCETDAQRLASVTIEGDPACASTTASRVAATSRPTTGRATRPSCCRTGLRCISISSLTTVD